MTAARACRAAFSRASCSGVIVVGDALTCSQTSFFTLSRISESLLLVCFSLASVYPSASLAFAASLTAASAAAASCFSLALSAFFASSYSALVPKPFRLHSSKSLFFLKPMPFSCSRSPLALHSSNSALLPQPRPFSA